MPSSRSPPSGGRPGGGAGAGGPRLVRRAAARLPIAIRTWPDGRHQDYLRSPIFAAHVPRADAPHVVLLAAGAVVIGDPPRSSAPVATFSGVRVTRNPYAPPYPRRQRGGRGGVAARMIPFADGSVSRPASDPAAFCGLVGLRTTPGLVPSDLLDPLSVVGPSPAARRCRLLLAGAAVPAAAGPARPAPAFCRAGAAARLRVRGRSPATCRCSRTSHRLATLRSLVGRAACDRRRARPAARRVFRARPPAAMRRC